MQLQLALPSLLALAPLASGQVLVVDDDGGPGVFTEIHLAVAAAVDGDTILVRDGGYIGFTIDAKRLDVIADQGATVAINGTVAVQNLSAAQAVLLHGLRAETLTNGEGLVVDACAGPVWIEDAEFYAPQTLAQLLYHGAAITGSSAVSIHRTRIVGGRGVSGHDAGAGLRAIGSSVFLFDVEVEGGAGSIAGFLPPYEPGAGVHLTDGLLLASGGSIRGGPGGDGISGFGCVDGDDGGVGLLLDGTAQAELLGVAPQGGPGGQTVFPCIPGKEGPALETPPGSVLDVPATARHLAIAGPVRPGDVITLVAEGQPGEQVLLLVALDQTPTLLTSSVLLGGVILPTFTPAVSNLGVCDAAGLLQVQAVAFQPPGLVLTTYAQAAFVHPSLTQPAVLGPAQSLTFLASGL